ncbi:hypothetical protein BT69DRAFT_68005 [Atractiella rhizophila]|nr:hypothetical protein BT69DRAFT_68005 [Atractiella rhizophila]
MTPLLPLQSPNRHHPPWCCSRKVAQLVLYSLRAVSSAAFVAVTLRKGQHLSTCRNFQIRQNGLKRCFLGPLAALMCTHDVSSC